MVPANLSSITEDIRNLHHFLRMACKILTAKYGANTASRRQVALLLLETLSELDKTSRMLIESFATYISLTEDTYFLSAISARLSQESSTVSAATPSSS